MPIGYPRSGAAMLGARPSLDYVEDEAKGIARVETASVALVCDLTAGAQEDLAGRRRVRHVERWNEGATLGRIVVDPQPECSCVHREVRRRLLDKRQAEDTDIEGAGGAKVVDVDGDVRICTKGSGLHGCLARAATLTGRDGRHIV